jgi:small subunit ribosomal protein S20
MPHHKSPAKRMRTSEKARQRNRSVKSHLRNVLKKVEQAAPDEADDARRTAIATLDRAARKGIIPKRRADRKKSRLDRAAARSASSAKSG